VASAARERAWSVVVPHHPSGARQARRRLAAGLGSLVRTELLTDALSVAAELVGNAVRHASPLPGGVIRVAWKVQFGRGVETVHLRVTDGGALTEPRIQPANADATDGRGLSIVAALAERWGVDHEGGGQSVWAEVAWPSRARTAAAAVGD
jgi:two-component sensor histidine kinase